MKQAAPLAAISVLATLTLAPAQAQLGPAPSWVLTEGAPGTCAADDVFLPGVFVNVPPPSFASEQGVFEAPGFPNLGFTQDSSFQGVGEFGFTVFTDPYVVPANTPLTLTVTTYHAANFQGGIAYISTITWDCTTGEVLAIGGDEPYPPAQEIPTLSAAGLAALVAALATLAMLALRRRRTSTN